MLISLLFWIVLILSAIGSFLPLTYGPRINSISCVVLFVLIGLRIFRIPLQ